MTRLTQQPKNPKIVFFGTPKFGAIVAENLIDAGFAPKIVVTRQDKPAGRGQKLSLPPVKVIAQKYGIEVLQPQKLRDNPTISHQLIAIKPDLGVVAAYGRIIPAEILKIPKAGILNLHPSILPKYRGASPIQAAILAGDAETGVTIILLDNQLDHGPILAQEKLLINNNETAETLSEKLAELGAKLLLETVPKYLLGKIVPQEQDHSKATFTSLVKKEAGYIDPDNLPDSTKFERLVRAFYPWPGVWTEIHQTRGKEVTRIRIKFLPNVPGLNLLISHPLSPFLIQPEGKRPMTVNQFINGYPETKSLIEKILTSNSRRF